MSDTTAPTTSPLAWYPTSHSCPRCNQPIKCRATPTFSKVLELICTKCGWRMDIEALRTSTKATAIPPQPDQETLPNAG